jgi:hypothetical protein
VTGAIDQALGPAEGGAPTVAELSFEEEEAEEFEVNGR